MKSKQKKKKENRRKGMNSLNQQRNKAEYVEVIQLLPEMDSRAELARLC